MHSKTIFRGLLAAVMVAAAGHSLLSPHATAAFPFTGKCLSQTGCSICCPVCDHVCKLDAEQVDAEIPCFDVESKVICIPRVVFPWQRKKCSSCDSCDGRGCTNCVHNGARVRRICVLKTDKITCPKCEYSWSTEKKCSGCDGGCDGCCDSGCDASITPAWESATSYQATESRVTESQVTESQVTESRATESRVTESRGLGQVPMQSIKISQPSVAGN